MEEIAVVVQAAGEPVEWVMKVTGDGPWQLRLESPDGEVAAVSGDNVFEMVREIRRSLAPRGVTLCVNGARIDTRPSGLSASHGAAGLRAPLEARPTGRPTSATGRWSNRYWV